MTANPETNIRILREMKGLTQENLAKELNLSTKAYQKIETGETQLTINRLVHISEILEISVFDILRFDGDNIFNVPNEKSIEKNKPITAENNLQKDNLLILEKDMHILTLKEEITFLKKIITKQLDL